MSKRLAILCPGQGGQGPAMFELAGSDSRVTSLPAQWLAQATSDRPLPMLLADRALLFSNRYAQPLIVAATLAAWEAIKDHAPPPALVAGYSIGELSAYAVAGALSAEDAVDLAAVRAQLMDACLHNAQQQSLMAISGLPAHTLRDVLQRHALHRAIESEAGSTIVGGLRQDMIAAERSIIESGGRVVALPVEIAAHTPLMQAAVTPFMQALQPRMNALHMPVLAGISARLIHRQEQAITMLARQIAETIHWTDCMDACAEAGTTIALELGPGAALSRMLRARHPHIECRSMADFRSLPGAAAWLGRHFD